MKLVDFDYELPPELIAQTPLEKRDQSRLMVLDRSDGTVEHHVFTDILSYLNEGDTLVLNDTKVIPARLIGIKEETNAVIEVLLLKSMEGNIWEPLVKPQKRVKEGTIISFGDGRLKARCVQKLEDGITHFELLYEGILYEVLEELGTMPLPPYIHKRLEDGSRYNTVYAKNLGSAAAPTAGLHFTEELLERIKQKQVHVVSITLHVGLWSFRPVTVDTIEDHHMHSEYYEMSEEVADILNQTKKEGHSIVAVGTTSVRTLETIMQKYHTFCACSGWTDIFIYPGYQFLAVDHLITNFHLPKSTLLMLISAFATREQVLHAYQIAVQEKYRFFSFGDSMFIL